MMQNDLDRDDVSARRLEELADRWLAGDPPNRGTDLRDAQALDDLLAHLVSTPQDLAASDLYLLSDLSQANAETVRQAWPTIPTTRRRETIRYLVDASNEDVALALGRILRIAMGDDDSETRRLAIEGLWEETNPNLVGPLTQILLNDPASPPRAAAARALGAYVLAGELDEIDAAIAMRAEEALLAVALREDEPVSVRASALEGLASSGEAGIRQLIEDAYYSPEELMRISALNAMGRSADVRWRGLARAELQNPDAVMRAAAAQACGELEVKAALDEIIELVSDDDGAVRIAAILALGRIGGKAAREVLEAVRLGDDDDEVDAADFALEELMFFAAAEGDPDATLLEDEADALDEWDIEPWQRGHDADDLDFGEYEA